MKKPISATISEELILWIEKQCEGTKFRNKSHLIETAIDRMRRGSR